MDVRLTASEKAKVYRAKNPGKAAADAKRWRQENGRVVSEYNKAFYAKNRDAEKARTKRYRAANIERYRELERRANKRKLEKNNRRRACFKSPLSKAHRLEMITFYEGCPNGYEVDHIVPLKHPLICGLHVPWNLQYLTIEENRKKGNRL